MSGSFTQKLLRASFVLPQGNFPGTSSNTLVVEGFRMSAHLEGAGNWTNFCSLDVYGMRQADMAALSVVWAGPQMTQVDARAILVLESNDGSGWLQVFEGQFQEAQADYSGMPYVHLHVEAATGMGQQWLTAAPSSFSGSVAVSTVAAQLAQQMGFSFENNGVSGQLNTPYYAGTLMDQFRDLARDGKFDFYFDPKSTLIVCPQNQPRQGRDTIPINQDTGLVGYPTLQRYGVQAKCLFTPAIELGSPIQLSDTEVPGADGTWFPTTFVYDLESFMPDGAWFALLNCLPNPAGATT